MSPPDDAHPDLDALSAVLDDEAPEWAAHVDRCDRCQAHLARLREVVGAVGRPVPPAAPDVVDRAVARALASVGSEPAEPTGADQAPAGPVSGRPGPSGPLSGRRGPSGPLSGRPGPSGPLSGRPGPSGPLSGRPGPSGPLSGRRGPSGPLSGRRGRTVVALAFGSVAAVLLVVLAASAVFDGGNRQVDTALAPAPEGMSAPEGGQGRAAGGALLGAAVVSGGDLGEVGDAATLAARLRGRIPGTDGAPAPLAGSPPAADAAPNPTAATAPARCEAEARAVDPDLGTLVYVAEGRRGGRPVTVLGFGGAPVTLLVLTLDGCGLVYSTAVP